VAGGDALVLGDDDLARLVGDVEAGDLAAQALGTNSSWAPLSIRRKLSLTKKFARIDSGVRPMALSRMVTGILRRRSTRKYSTSFGSNSKSSQEPRYGMMRALNSSLPELCVLPLSCSKNTPGERCSCETMTRSVPLMMNEPLSVIRGTSPM
jgi:hypothetical protein